MKGAPVIEPEGPMLCSPRARVQAYSRDGTARAAIAELTLVDHIDKMFRQVHPQTGTYSPPLALILVTLTRMMCDALEIPYCIGSGVWAQTGSQITQSR